MHRKTDVVDCRVILEARALGKRYGSRSLFRDLSFRMETGDAVAVTGANGSGKSTLLRIVGGLLTPTSGHVDLHVDGRRLSREQHPLHTGLVAPYLNVYDAFTPRENLHFLARARRLEDARRRIDEMLDLVALSDRADDPVHTFSSGMKQRVKFAAALLSDPPLLLLDEPSVNLDAPGLEMVDRLADRQRKSGGVLLVATNDAREAARYDRNVRIEDFH